MDDLELKAQDYAKVMDSFDQLASLMHHLSSKECTAEHHTQMITEIILSLLEKYGHGRYELWLIANALENESYLPLPETVS